VLILRQTKEILLPPTESGVHGVTVGNIDLCTDSKENDDITSCQPPSSMDAMVFRIHQPLMTVYEGDFWYCGCHNGTHPKEGLIFMDA